MDELTPNSKRLEDLIRAGYEIDHTKNKSYRDSDGSLRMQMVLSKDGQRDEVINMHFGKPEVAQYDDTDN